MQFSTYYFINFRKSLTPPTLEEEKHPCVTSTTLSPLPYLFCSPFNPLKSSFSSVLRLLQSPATSVSQSVILRHLILFLGNTGHFLSFQTLFLASVPPSVLAKAPLPRLHLRPFEGLLFLRQQVCSFIAAVFNVSLLSLRTVGPQRARSHCSCSVCLPMMLKQEGGTRTP